MKKTKLVVRYPKTLKRKIAREYLSGKFSYAIAAEEYGLKSKNVVKEFVRWYKKSLYLEGMESSKQSNESIDSTADLDELRALAAELSAAQLKIAGLETLIDLAEQELQVDIRKKSGTKQSK